MKKIVGALIATSAVIGLCSCKKSSSSYEKVDENRDIDMTSYVVNLMEKTPSYVPFWNKEASFKGRWNYIDGVYLQSMLQLYKKTNDVKYKDFVINYVNYYINEDGEFQYLGTDPAGTGWASTEGLDTVCESQILFDLYDLTKDNRYKKAIDKSYKELISNNKIQDGPNFEHKPRYVDSIFLDGMYMYVPFYSQYAKANNKTEIFSEIKSQYEYIRNNMRDSKTGLYFHGHQSTKEIFWADSKTGNSKSIWSRSLGWLAMSLADSIEYFPNGKNKNYLISMLDELLDSLSNYEDSDTHMFYQLTAIGKKSYLVSYDKYLKKLNSANYSTDSYISNYLESSGSSMFAYAYMKASRLGYTNKEYYKKGYEIFKGIYDHSYDNDNNMLNDICITAGLGPEKSPHRDGSAQYYLAEKVGSDDAKGTGPFIMAYIEYKYY